MRRRIDKVNDARGKAARTRGSPHWPHAVFQPAMHRGNYPVATSCADEAPRESLAQRLERDHRLAGRVANWLFIKGGMALLMMLGLFALGLMGLFQGGR